MKIIIYIKNIRHRNLEFLQKHPLIPLFMPSDKLLNLSKFTPKWSVFPCFSLKSGQFWFVLVDIICI